MDTVGIVGFGSMGGMLARALVRGGVAPERIALSTRTTDRARSFIEDNPGARLLDLPAFSRLAGEKSTIFIAVPPREVKPVLDSLRGFAGDDCHIVSFAAAVTLAELESAVPCAVTRVIPNVAGEVDSGVYLVAFGSQVSAEQRAGLSTLLSASGAVEEIPESLFEVATELTSCGPGILSAVFSEFARAANRHAPLGDEAARRLLNAAVSGLARLYEGTGLNYDDTISRVATKGGITEIGVSLLRERLPAVFDELFSRSLARHAERAAERAVEFGPPGVPGASGVSGMSGDAESTAFKPAFRAPDSFIRIEERSLNAWPALETRVSRGCVLRAARGYTKRANSANALYANPLDAEAVIADAETFFAAHSLPTIFKIPDFASYRELDARLAAHGYEREAETIVMTVAAAADPAGTEPPARLAASEPEVVIERDFTDEWIAAFARAGNLSPRDEETAGRILRAVSVGRRVASIRAGGETVAFGYAALEDGCAGYYDVMVAKEARRRGYARALMSALMAEARDAGTATHFLQVVAANEAAVNLYRSLGFRESYRYWYRVRD